MKLMRLYLVIGMVLLGANTLTAGEAKPARGGWRARFLSKNGELHRFLTFP